MAIIKYTTTISPEKTIMETTTNKFLDKIIGHRIIWDPVMYVGGLWYYIGSGIKKIILNFKSKNHDSKKQKLEKRGSIGA